MSEAADTPYWKAGKDGESLVKNILLNDGWWVVDVNKTTNNTAPLIESGQEKYRLPDIIGMRGYSKMAFFEVKQKKDGPEYIKIHKRHEHCIDEPAYTDYMEIARRSNIPTYLCIYESPSEWQRLLWRDVTKLNKADTIADNVEKDYGKPQVFFPRSEFNNISAVLSGDAKDSIYIENKPLKEYTGVALPVEGSRDICSSQLDLDEFLDF